jgi:DNA-binding beta-propeller fold protein YncE
MSGLTGAVGGALCAAFACALSPAAAAASAATTFTQVPGSPFTTLGSPGGGGDQPFGLAFNPKKLLLDTGNGDGSISEFRVAEQSGSLTQLPGGESAPYVETAHIAWNGAGTILAAGNDEEFGSSLATLTIGAGGGLVERALVEPGPAVNGVAFSPDGKYLAAAVSEYGDPEDPGAVAVYTVHANGTITSVSGSPFSVTMQPVSVAFSPNGHDLAVANAGSGTVSVLKVGTFKAIPGSPFPAGIDPQAVTYRPNGHTLAIAESGSDVVSLKSVAKDGALTSAGSADVVAPQDVAWSPNGKLLAASSQTGSDSVFCVTGDGTLTTMAGSPYTVGALPEALAFSPDNRFLATANSEYSTVTMLAAG